MSRLTDDPFFRGSEMLQEVYAEGFEQGRKEGFEETVKSGLRAKETPWSASDRSTASGCRSPSSGKTALKEIRHTPRLTDDAVFRESVLLQRVYAEGSDAGFRQGVWQGFVRRVSLRLTPAEQEASALRVDELTPDLLVDLLSMPRDQRLRWLLGAPAGQLASLPANAEPPSLDLAGPLVIHRSADDHGATYSLSASSKRCILVRFPEAYVSPRIFVAHTTEQDRECIRESMQADLTRLLTGLSDAQLSQLGGAQFQDPVSQRVLGRWAPAHA